MQTLVYSNTIIIKTIDCDSFVDLSGGNMKNIMFGGKTKVLSLYCT